MCTFTDNGVRNETSEMIRMKGGRKSRRGKKRVECWHSGQNGKLPLFVTCGSRREEMGSERREREREKES